MLMSIEGLITKSINIGDNNRLISILTKSQGIIYAFVNNCKKISSKMLAGTEVFSYCGFVLFKNKEKYCVNEIQVIKQFPQIRQDINRLSLSCYFLELFNELACEGQPSEDYLRLLLNSLYILDKNKKDITTIKSVTELRVVSIAGYLPDLICCSECKSFDNKNVFFFSMSGKLRCINCENKINKKNNNISIIKDIRISSGVLFAMRHIIYTDISKIFSFKISSNDLLILSKLSEDYLLSKTDLNLSSLSYFKQISKYQY